MRRLIYFGVAVALLVGADLAAKAVAESRIEAKAEGRGGAGSQAEAGVGGFPFVPRALLAGRVSSVDVAMTGVRAGPLRVSSVDLALSEVRLDRSRLRSGQVSVTEVGGARVAVELATADLAATIGLPVAVVGEDLRVTVAGRQVTVTPKVSVEGAVEFPGLDLGLGLAARALRLDRVGITGCSSVTARARLDHLRVECLTGKVPPVLAR